MSVHELAPALGAEPSWSPTAIHAALDEALGAAGFADVWVTGTLAGLRRSGRWLSGELTDFGPSGSAVATLSVGMPGAAAIHITEVLRAAGTELADGLELRLRGRLEADARFGRVRLLATDVDPRCSLGAAALARDALLAELGASGRLAAQSRLAVVGAPRRVMLVSGSGAAGRDDALAVLVASGHPFEVTEVEVPLSGPRAPAALAAAVGRACGSGAEVVVLARGGGARSELAAFDHPEVAGAVADCPVPVWSAVGHARDRSVVDLVAHASFPTPSAAAGELVRRAEEHEQLERAARAARRHAEQLAATRRRARVAVTLALAVVVVVLLLLR